MFSANNMIASSKVTERAQERWDSIVDRFRAACILHHKNRTAESRRIIKEELPPLVRAWIQMLPTALKEDAKADLSDMFQREQSIVEQGAKLERLFKETLVKKIIPQVEAQISAKYRSLYLNGYERRKQQREEKEDRSWVSPSYGDPSNRSATNMRPLSTNKRVKLRDVSEMIDSLRDSEAEELADSLVSMDDIVSSLDAKGITSILADA